MKPRTQLISISFVLSIVVAGLYAFIQWDDWFSDKSIPLSAANQPDLIALTVQQSSFNDHGERQYQLKAESMLQFLETNRNLMIKPDITFYQDRVPSWTTTAKEAVSDNTGEALNLSGNVTIRQQNVPKSATMETDTLILYPEKSYATTEDKVIIRQQGIYIEAIGLDADLNHNRITLRKNVTSIYEPEES